MKTAFFLGIICAFAAAFLLFEFQLHVWWSRVHKRWHKNQVCLYDFYKHNACDIDLKRFHHVFGFSTNITEENLWRAYKVGLPLQWVLALHYGFMDAPYKYVMLVEKHYNTLDHGKTMRGVCKEIAEHMKDWK